MAQHIVVQLGCDLENGKGVKDVETVTFCYQGDNYEIELCGKHHKPLDELLGTLIPAARRVRSGDSAKRSGARASRGSRDENAAIRAWANSKGLKVSERGRISASVIEQYRAAV